MEENSVKQFWIVAAGFMNQGAPMFEEMYVFNVEDEAKKKLTEIEARIERGQKIYKSGTHCADAHLYARMKGPIEFGEYIWSV